MWSEGHVWRSPERLGQITGIMKLQVDHLPLSMGGMRPTQGRTLAVMQVSAGSQSFNSANNLRVLGRWMRMVTIPNQTSGCCQSDANRSLRDACRFLERSGLTREDLPLGQGGGESFL
jgi:arsenical resistance protein ArsH